MTGAPGELVLAEHRGPVLLLTFNRPAKLNAWTDELENRYFTLLDAAEDDPDVRAVVVTGAGRGFCVGADLQRLQAVGEVSEADRSRRRPRDMPFSLRKPLIGAVNVEGVASHLDKRSPNFASLPVRSSDVPVRDVGPRREVPGGSARIHGFAHLPR